jgi:AhpD family alkylhydroperoxidase
MGAEHRVHLSKAAPPAYQALTGFAKTVGGLAADAGIEPALKELVQIHTSQLNGCAYCVRVHLDKGLAAGLTVDTVAQLPVWRDSGVFDERQRAALELAEAFAFIAEDGIPDDVYDTVGGIFSEDEYVALSWILVSINAFNRLAIAGRYPVPPRADSSS